MPGQGIIILAGLALVLLLVLVQIYLSWRPGLVWGLFLPAVFLVFLLFLALAPASLTSGFVLNEAGKNTFYALCQVGFLSAVLILAFTRIGKMNWHQRRERERQQRIAAKQQRQEAEAACLEAGGSLARSAELAEQEKMEQARQQALADSERELQALEQKRQIRGNQDKTMTPEAIEETPERDSARQIVASAVAAETAAESGLADAFALPVTEDAAEAEHINRVYSPAAARQVAVSLRRVGGRVGRAAAASGRYLRAAGRTILAVSRSVAQNTAQAASGFWQAAKPQLILMKQRIGVRLAAGKKSLAVPAKDNASALDNPLALENSSGQETASAVAAEETGRETSPGSNSETTAPADGENSPEVGGEKIDHESNQDEPISDMEQNQKSE